MRIKKLKNVSRRRITVHASNGMEISLPPNESYSDNLDVTNLDDLGEKVSYTADLTEVGKADSGKKKLYD